MLVNPTTNEPVSDLYEAFDMAIKALKQEPIDKSAMMYEIYMEGVNMSGEYQGWWVRFKNIEKIVDKYMAESEDKWWLEDVWFAENIMTPRSQVDISIVRINAEKAKTITIIQKI